MTDSPLEKTRSYFDQQDYEFPILAGAEETLDHWGVGMVWGNVVYLVDPDGMVVAEGVEDADEVLTSRTQ